MTLDDILATIDAEITQLQRARALLSGSAGTTTAKTAKQAPAPAKKRKRKMTPEGRARIVAAVKARWAKQKKAAK